MLPINMEKVADIMRDVAETCLLPRFGALRMGDISFKSGDDPVTIADKEAESELSRRLLDLLPGSNIVGEEAFAENPGILSRFSGEDPVWIVDPLDGTKAFVASDPVYGVIVALAKQDQTIAGWLYDPTSRECVMAEKGAGAFHKGQRLAVLPPDRLENMAGIFGHRLRKAYEACKPAGPKPTFYGMLSACHDYASLAVSEPHFARRLPAQMHFHGTYCTCTPWDMAAGVLVHEEAGGFTAHWDGSPFRPADYGRGVFSAPDEQSWLALRGWIGSFCSLKS